MISAAELKIQRRITTAFIEADSLVVTLTRTLRVTDNAGGLKKGAVTTVFPQTMRLIPSQDGTAERLTADGLAVSPQYMLMGEYNADLARFDTFEVDGRRYEVVFVNANRQYETKAEVAYVGN